MVTTGAGAEEDSSSPLQEERVRIIETRRKQAKQIAFGLIYGIGAKLLAVKLSDPKSGLIVTPEEAQNEMDIFFKQHPKLKTFKAKQEKFLKKHGYLR